MLPLSLLRTAVNHPMLVELKNGETYNGHLDGDRFWRMPECYIRGSTIKYLRIPDEVIDMVKEEVVQKSKGRGDFKGGRGGGQRGRGRGSTSISKLNRSRRRVGISKSNFFKEGIHFSSKITDKTSELSAVVRQINIKTIVLVVVVAAVLAIAVEEVKGEKEAVALVVVVVVVAVVVVVVIVKVVAVAVV
ncbi:U6 snRNA-associated Sm-like protein LSm4 [Elysia marginata]|uniref:U6 snRNA-associated Sm-like protein LSm4 n=1 Tax=Elysia marginata TaxID=1093978 RepID=A0AAV4EAP6_9GAST|nr:U6 snRNA-associated Sm-like protein LSm4 [Elysia marginata]